MKKPAFLSKPLAAAPKDHAAAGDLFRVICALMIGWYHIWQQSWLSPALRIGSVRVNLTPYVRAGYMFVDLMLLLSGFLLYLPFVAIDLIISNLLLAMGMMMVSPMTISLPFKLLLFVTLDGWLKISQGLLLSYH